MSEDESEYKDAGSIDECIENVERIACAMTNHCTVSAEDILYMPNVQDVETGTF